MYVIILMTIILKHNDGSYQLCQEFHKAYFLKGNLLIHNVAYASSNKTNMFSAEYDINLKIKMVLNE